MVFKGIGKWNWPVIIAIAILLLVLDFILFSGILNQPRSVEVTRPDFNLRLAGPGVSSAPVLSPAEISQVLQTLSQTKSAPAWAASSAEQVKETLSQSPIRVFSVEEIEQIINH